MTNAFGEVAGRKAPRWDGGGVPGGGKQLWCATVYIRPVPPDHGIAGIPAAGVGLCQCAGHD